MRRVLTEEDAVQRPYLIEYDPRNPSPHFSPELINYIESRQSGLSDADIAKLDEIEFFVLNIYFPGVRSCAIPGIRARAKSDVRYVKRFNTGPYLKMLNQFLDFVPADFPPDQIARCHFQAIRLTLPDGAQFYPIEFNGNLDAWRKRLNDNAVHFNTLLGCFEGGKFVVSNGERFSISDMTIDWVAQKDSSADFY